MKLPLYQVDAFTSEVFHGNPAAVCPLNEWLSDDQMHRIAAENNLSETAFYVPKGNDFSLRWFTPTVEVSLCGHATLASAYVLFEIYKYSDPQVHFHTKSGLLSVRRDNGGFVMNFPADHYKETPITPLITRALGINPKKVVQGKNILMAELSSEKELRELFPEIYTVMQVHPHGLIVTAKGDNVDFVSRCFFPNAGINEDPVTGSAHTLLTPYWSEKLNKKELKARQISKRGGDLNCSMLGDRVEIGGNAVLYMRGEIEI
ncbi:MAG: PhzF family phenazine biosynthesis protein [Bacteroidetes bacterium]|nr:MAG: PhzF family phenazine biosynthesis protein [Bacteroidota bacterium]REK03433.1 MAG: PhzF family phenazine biosynthesis protein [Bacteroidota bacterium]REK34455.1 MAG: PhzF family phenazine biosynthesis protein [Bacteroidota bacterium]REK50426.1 MAG: PhzF family phenazine biosynthesis protein [Bacteroidota bacterium]